jgi:hypothetical protein
MSQENVAVVRQGWDAWVRGDLPVSTEDAIREAV